MKINNYIWEKDLSLNDLVLKQKEEIERLNNIINNAIEFINGGKGWKKYKYTYQEQKLLEILDKEKETGSDKE